MITLFQLLLSSFTQAIVCSIASYTAAVRIVTAKSKKQGLVTAFLFLLFVFLWHLAEYLLTAVVYLPSDFLKLLVWTGAFAAFLLFQVLVRLGLAKWVDRDDYVYLAPFAFATVVFLAWLFLNLRLWRTG